MFEDMQMEKSLSLIPEPTGVPRVQNQFALAQTP
jgi:hypothetical protein